jgi:hypothetical protein
VSGRTHSVDYGETLPSEGVDLGRSQVSQYGQVQTVGVVAEIAGKQTYMSSRRRNPGSTCIASHPKLDERSA